MDYLACGIIFGIT